jgi:small subunit ribosomal protein S14
MATRVSIEKNKTRRKKAAKAFAKRQALKKLIMDKNTPAEERFRAVVKLAEMPRNGAKIRIRNRCALTGRARGYHRKFGLSRLMLRELASKGQIPGVTKASW